MRGLLVAACGAAIALASAAALWSSPEPASAASAVTCTFEEKQAALASLRKLERELPAQRRAYFRRHKSKSARAAFVRRQQQRLRAARTATACTVPPLPPASTASCSFMLAPNAEEERSAHVQPHEGAIRPGWALASLGRVTGVVLMLDFPDAPGEGSAPGLAPAYAPDPDYFEEASYGRFDVDTESVDRWIRMPRPSSAYWTTPGWQNTYFTDAITAADPFVDFSRYQFVVLVATRRVFGRNQGWSNRPGGGVETSEGEIRFGASVASDMVRFGKLVVNHEFMHALGLPDVYFGDATPGTWDPMSTRPSGGSPGSHLFGWHKWRLGWLDPDQLTCVVAPGAVEETLTAIARAGGKKMVVVPTSASTAYVVETRVRVGADREVCDEGVLVYDVDSQLSNAQTRDGRGALRVHGPRGCGTSFGAFAFQTGEAFEDSVIRVEVLGRDANAFRVRVTRK